MLNERLRHGDGMTENEFVAMIEQGDHYFARLEYGPYREITREEWMALERLVGFVPKFHGHPATGGFSAKGVEGFTFSDRHSKLDQYAWDPARQAAIEEAMPRWQGRS